MKENFHCKPTFSFSWEKSIIFEEAGIENFLQGTLIDRNHVSFCYVNPGTRE